MLIRSDQEIEKIQYHINNINEKIFQQENANIIIGDTGEGKTTLLGYLTGIPLFSREDDYGDYIIYTKDSNIIDINNRPISQTSIPTCRGIYWDCPGFGDTRGPVQNIVNAYSIFKLVESVEKLKILLVVSESIIKSTRKKEFLNLINNLGETFKNIDELVQGLCLIITKSDKLDVRKVRTCFRKILEEYDNQESFSQPTREILNFLSSPESQIVFFNAPNQEGQISDTDKFLILESIEKISYLTNLESKVLLDDKSKLYINNLVDRFYNDIKDYISLKFYPAIQNYFEIIIDKHLGTVKELRNSLIVLSNKFKNIYDESEKFEENLQQILLIVEFIQRNDLKEELLKKISLLKFFKLVKSESFEIKGNTNSWYNYISELINELEILTSIKVYNQGNILTLEGVIIGTEDLVIAMNDQELSEINIFSLNSLFIDKDINAPGINLTMISPQWRVIGKRIINLKGNSGFSHKPNKANDGIPSTKDEQINNDNEKLINDEQINNDDEKLINDEKINYNTSDKISFIDEQNINGEDGLPGLPGYCGGNFYGKGNTFFNLSSLTINVSGGDGGQGQDGGNGANGLDGNNFGEEFVKNKEYSALMSREKVKIFPSDEEKARFLDKVIKCAEKCAKFVITFNDKHEETYEYFNPGQKGGNGGRGGIGGFGGKPGIVLFDSSSKLLETPIIFKESERGINGKGGKPGLGGKHGQKYRGVYINERIFPALRGINEFDSKCNVSGAVVGATEAAKKTFLEKLLIDLGLAASPLAFSVPAAIAGLGITLAAQTACSAVSAKLSSGWKVAPHKVDNDGFDEHAPEGEFPDSSNEDDIKIPFDRLPCITTGEKEKLYKQFYDQTQNFKVIKELLCLERTTY
ncbi:29223_t:CDS:2 [Gigaspora margarita]|uniref:29223_t:CDS:1 n=1 Tax=Gigaspora margarita TaxID=4874 RepID=A0ABN7VMH5_GIGMA|nr:29223_t:CDS:2 [Gigaspora margarita]